jgi:hypothetical protein
MSNGAFRPNAPLKDAVVLTLVIALVDGDTGGIEVLHPRPGTLFSFIEGVTNLV